MKNNIDNLSLFVTNLLEHMGLSQFNSEIYRMTLDASFCLSLRTQIYAPNMLSGEQSLIKEVVKNWFKSVEESKMVQDMRFDLDQKIKTLEEDNKLLKAQVSELSIFKNYYDVQMNLNHGK